MLWAISALFLLLCESTAALGKGPEVSGQWTPRKACLLGIPASSAGNKDVPFLPSSGAFCLFLFFR